MPAQRMRSVIPPYMLRRIIEHGNAPQRDCALHTLNHVQSLLGNKPLRSPTEKNARAGEALRDIYDAQNGTQLPGKQVRKEGQPSNHDVAVDEAYDYLGVTYDFFWQAYRRNSLDNQGLPLVGSVHYGKEYQNAFWNGQQMVFGDGDGEIFNRFTIAIDVVGHELAHGVTESEAGLIYYQQSGALNESLSDVFGSLVKQFHLQQTADKADWLIGAGLLAEGIKGQGLRSMSAPGTAYDDPLLGKDPQPASMKDYIQTKEDNGGVHLNSGIPNRAFYLAATALGGFAWEKAGYVWYDTVCDKALPQNADFATFARTTMKHALARFDQNVADKVQQAWHQVGGGIMKPLPTLNQDTVIELAREGGFAYIPKLAGQRRIALADITPEQRQRLNQLLNQTLPYAQEEGQPTSPGCGDQRYYRVQINYTSPTLSTEIVLLIPESSAPQALVDLWKTGQVDE